MRVIDRISRVIPRCRSFYAARTPGHFLVSVSVAVPTPSVPPLFQFDMERQLEEYLDHLLAVARPRWAAKEGIDDDTIPSICPFFGAAEHSAWTGAQVRLQEDTCLATPQIHTWDDLDKLRLSEEAPWYGYMKRGYHYLRQRQDGSFVLSVRGADMPMDLANAIRGDDLFEDMLVDKANAHRLMAWCTQAIRWYYDRLLGWADEIDGGHVYFYNSSWMGPRVLGHVSNDAATICSRDIYDEFGFPYEKELASSYGGLFYHVHTQHMQFLPRAATLPGLMLMEMTPDPQIPPPIEDLRRILTVTGGANLLVYGDAQQIRKNIESLKARNVFIHARCKTAAEAADIVRFVRGHSKPL